MSRYDWGRQHPGVDRLRHLTCVDVPWVPRADGVGPGPTAMQTVADRCGDEARRADCSGTVETDLDAGLRLWDGIAEALDTLPQVGP